MNFGLTISVGSLASILIACEDPAARSIELGDRLLAVGDAEEAIAEYKLAQRISGDTEELLLRLGHAYSVRGDVDGALGYFEPLVERSDGFRHQIAADLIAMAYDARERGARENMSRSLQLPLAWGLGYVPTELQRALAGHYASDGDYTRALSLYLALLAEETEPAPGDLYQTGRAYKELGGCDRALPYLEEYVDIVPRRDPTRGAARYHYGDCLFLSADEDRAAGRPTAALAKLDRMVELGVPRSHLVEAHFFRGEMLLSSGDTEAARLAYRRVLDLSPNRTAAHAVRAEERIRQIRFGF
ncbi:MAG: tetratricopeptide repeat protein [Gemmatimonadetes bacterium]|nr:tetratricopeptide repeat protein [Gemmatimonadota bacterium]